MITMIGRAGVNKCAPFISFFSPLSFSIRLWGGGGGGLIPLSFLYFGISLPFSPSSSSHHASYMSYNLTYSKS